MSASFTSHIPPQSFYVIYKRPKLGSIALAAADFRALAELFLSPCDHHSA
jgi:hypothetical protein